MLPAHPFTNSSVLRVTRNTLLLAGITASTVIVQAQSAAADAQVQSAILTAIASTPELANQSVTTQTVAGTVTLTGSVLDEAARRKAENLAANIAGVQRVVDQLTLTSGATSDFASPQTGAASMVLQSDGTYAPADVQPAASMPSQQIRQTPRPPRSAPETDQGRGQHQQQNQAAQQGIATPANNATAPAPCPCGSDGGNPQYGRRPMSQNYPYSQQGSYPSQYPTPGYPQRNSKGYPQRYPGPYAQPYPQGQWSLYGGQAAGQPILIPAGVLVSVRINRTLSSDKTPAGTTFDGVIVNDVSAGGYVAIPRGASVQGTVIESNSSGTFKGRGELSIQLTEVTLAGHVYPIFTDVWAHNGGDKTIETINKTVGFGAAGLILGAIAGGGTGAAIGGGVGAAAGLGSSAASDRGQVYIPSEALVTFHLARDAHVETVSAQEVQRLAYGVAPWADQRNLRSRNSPRVYVGPRYPRYYYPGPYGPYGYPPY